MGPGSSIKLNSEISEIWANLGYLSLVDIVFKTSNPLTYHKRNYRINAAREISFIKKITVWRSESQFGLISLLPYK